MSKKMIETIPATVKVRELPKAIGSVLLFVSEDWSGNGSHVYGAVVRTGMAGWIGTYENRYLNNHDVQKLIESNENVGSMGGTGHWVEPDEQEATYIS